MAIASTAAVLAAGIALRAALGRWPHSGQGIPPMHGDFEAQRHWLEVTSALPRSAWYVNGTDNDLQYWGLDYPPLTAWHSLAMGTAALAVRPSLVELGASRGAEAPKDRAFMRATALLSDCTVLVPALLLAAWASLPRGPLGRQAGRPALSGWMPTAVALPLLSAPGLLLIDHGHFQYNGVSLGLAVAAGAAMALSRPGSGGLALRVASAGLFSAALSYKQMLLFLAPAAFVAHLAAALRGVRSARGLLLAAAEVAAVGAAVLASTAAVWLPLCGGTGPDDATAATALVEAAGERAAGALSVAVGPRCALTLLAALGRVFPFGRGLFEDKVASLWCALEPALRVRRRLLAGSLSLQSVLAAAAALTLLLLAPAAASAVRAAGCCSGTGRGSPVVSPRRWLVWWGAVSCASGLAFFLGAFQVHEKSVLIPVVPLALVAGVAMAGPGPVRSPAGSAAAALHCWLGPLTVAGMGPLLLRDGLAVPSAAAVTVALAADSLLGARAAAPDGWLGAAPFLLAPPLLPRTGGPSSAAARAGWHLRAVSAVHSAAGPPLSLAHAAVLALWAVVPPPARLPDLFPQLMATVHCGALAWALVVATSVSWQAAGELAEGEDEAA